MKHVICALKDGLFFKNIFDKLKDVYIDIEIKFTEDGMMFQGMDSAHVCMLDFFWSKDDFDIYNPPPSRLSFGILTVNLSKILKLLPSGGAIQINYYDNKPDTIEIVMLNADDVCFDIEMKLMDLDMEELEIPNLDYDLNVEYNTDSFKTILKDLNDFGDTITLFTKDGRLCINSEGDIGKVKCTLPLQVNVSEPLNLHVSSRYFIYFSKFSFCSDKFKMNVSNELPINLMYPFKTKSYLNFFLAPQIRDD